MAIQHKYPRLELVLAEDGDKDLLLEAVLFRSEFQKSAIKFRVDRGHDAFRGWFILLLLVKYRVEVLGHEPEQMKYVVKRRDSIWITALAPAMQDSERRPLWLDDIRTHLGSIFFEAKRLSASSRATYFNYLMPLSSLKISTAPRRESGSGPFLSTVLEGDALLDYARKLEGKVAGWHKVVEAQGRGVGETLSQKTEPDELPVDGHAVKGGQTQVHDNHPAVRRSATGAEPWKIPGESVRQRKLKFELLKLMRAGKEQEAIELIAANRWLCSAKLPPVADCALIMAITYKRNQVINYLLGRPEVNINRRNEHGVTPILKAASVNNFKLIKILVEEKKADYKAVNDMGANVIYEAAFAAGRDAYAIIKYFHEECEEKIPCDQQIRDGFYPLSQAIWRKCDERTIRYLIDHTADLNAEDFYGETPFFKAVKYSYFEAVNLLIDLGKNRLRRHETPTGNLTDRASELFCAVSTGDLRRVKQLLADGNDDVDEADAEFGRSPLHEAVEQGHLQIVKMLIDHGANVFVQNNHGRIPRDFLPSNRTPVSEQIEDVLVAAEEKWIETEWAKLGNSGRAVS